MRPTNPTLEDELNDPRAYVRTDPCASDMSIRVEQVADGDIELVLAVEERMLNGLGVCHGGVIFLLADTALAYAARQRGGMHASTWGTVSFLRPTRLGDTVIARPRLIDDGRRRSHYDVEVSNQDGETVALFRGQAVRVDPDDLQKSE